jgi:hypothetical protein
MFMDLSSRATFLVNVCDHIADFMALHQRHNPAEIPDVRRGAAGVDTLHAWMDRARGGEGDPDDAELELGIPDKHGIIALLDMSRVATALDSKQAHIAALLESVNQAGGDGATGSAVLMHIRDDRHMRIIGRYAMSMGIDELNHRVSMVEVLVLQSTLHLSRAAAQFAAMYMSPSSGSRPKLVEAVRLIDRDVLLLPCIDFRKLEALLTKLRAGEAHRLLQCLSSLFPVAAQRTRQKASAACLAPAFPRSAVAAIRILRFMHESVRDLLVTVHDDDAPCQPGSSVLRAIVAFNDDAPRTETLGHASDVENVVLVVTRLVAALVHAVAIITCFRLLRYDKDIRRACRRTLLDLPDQQSFDEFLR